MAKVSSIVTNFFVGSLTGKNNKVGEKGVNRVISLEEVAMHDHFKDCWIVIYDRIYDVSEFMEEHPGGSELLMEYAGRDATVAFRGSGHSEAAVLALKEYFIGELPMTEKIFRNPGGYFLSDMPE